LSGGITTSAGVSGFAAVSADEDMVVELGHKSSLMDAGWWWQTASCWWVCELRAGFLALGV